MNWKQLTNKISKNVGLTANFLRRKKKNNFSIIRFIRWAFRNYGKSADVKYSRRFRKYFKASE